MALTPASRKLGPRLAGGSFIVLSILLPVLIAFRNIAEPPAAGERERVAAVLAAATPQETLQGFFYELTLPENAASQWVGNEHLVVAQARRAGLLALLVISGLLYVLVAMVRGRTAAVLSCLCLCLVPAFASEGYVLRPEQCATMIGLLGVLLVHLYPDALRRRGHQGPVFRWLNLAGIVVCVSVCFGVAMACLPQAGIYLLLPGGALLLVAFCLAAVFPRVVRRRSIVGWPYRATTYRLLPWIAMGLMNLALGWVVLVMVPTGPAAASGTDVGMLPGPLYLLVPALLLLLLGGLRMVLGIGLRLGRQGRVGRDALLLIYAAALVLDHLRGGSRDHLPAAPALAILMAEGAAVLLLLGAGRLAGAGRN